MRHGVAISGDALFIPVNWNIKDSDIGDLAVFSYGSGVEKSHVALITEIDKKKGRYFITEANKTPCKETKRWVSWDDPTLLGIHRIGAGRPTLKANGLIVIE